MILFWTLVGGLIALALAFILLPVLRLQPLPRGTEVDQDQLNLEVFQQRLAELDSDLGSGLLDQDQYDAARRDLERELLSDLKGHEQLTRPTRRPWVLALALTVLIPALSVLAYLQTGQPDLIEAPRAEASGTLDELVGRLEQRLAQEPNNPEGWLMLGRTYLAIDRPHAAVKALERAYTLAPQSVEVLLAYAEALGLVDPNKSLLGRPAELIAAALEREPDNANARWFAGLIAFQRGQYQSAINVWQGLLDGLDPGSEEAGNLRQVMDEARRRAGMPVASDTPAAQAASTDQQAASAVRLVIQVSLDPNLADQVLPEDTVFVLARAASGPQMPLAIQRLKVKDLPATVILDDSHAMDPNIKLSSFETYQIVARTSRSGDAAPQAGDLFGERKGVRRTDAMPLVLSIDQIRR
ncbi:c-type cytochrome biogenesis protein CcmI [Caldichromatium japonicum]|uniref:C-type cytochrome biogenesis protein CcmI n=1 Tax=Caldichromatium japonicum TaxID=2699430 RepID=A0A6G7VEK1_9GAMM|nr:c-type cytochrome biogenesis protein CcmI [Caldichromatium japonicum]QIK38469.1 c-type cytochrome biogenesis protein CcmI [Caldichromatium japonicum]